MVILIFKPYSAYIGVECRSRRATSAPKRHLVPAVAWALLRTSTHKENESKANAEVGACLPTRSLTRFQMWMHAMVRVIVLNGMWRKKIGNQTQRSKKKWQLSECLDKRKLQYSPTRSLRRKPNMDLARDVKKAWGLLGLGLCKKLRRPVKKGKVRNYSNHMVKNRCKLL